MAALECRAHLNEIKRALAKDALGCLVLLLAFAILAFVFFDGNAVGPSRAHTTAEMLTTPYFVDAIVTSPLLETPVLALMVSLIAALAGIVAQRPRAFQIAIVISAILFALMHVTIRLGYGVMTVWPAYVMAGLYAKFAQSASPMQGLCLATIVHSIHNCVAFTIMYLLQQLSIYVQPS